MQVIRLILGRQIEPRMAGRCSTLLQIASLNLKQTTLEPAHREEVVFDPSTVRDTLLDEDVWCEEDFKEEEEDEEPYQGDNAQTGSCPDLMAVAEPLPSLEEKLHFPQLRENIFQVVEEAARRRGVKTTR